MHTSLSLTSLKLAGTAVLAFLPCFAAHAAAEAPQADQAAASSGDIVVTASKRGTKLKDVPISVSEVSSESLAQHNVVNLSGVQHVVPAVRFETVTGTPQIFIRGVGGGGRNIGFDPRVGVYVDGVFIGDTASLDSMLVGVESVEVLRGPQGFLFGASTDAGAINIVTRAPDNHVTADGSIAYGRFNDVELMAHASAPLGDKVFADVSAVRTTRDGYIRNLYDGSHPNDLNAYGVRARLRFVPTDDLTFDLSADYSRTQSHLVVGEAVTNAFGTAPSGNPPYTIDQNDPELDRREAGGVSARLQYKGRDLNISSISAYRTSNRRWVTDTDHTPLSLLTVDYRDKYRTFSQEITLTSADRTSRLRYLAGLYFADSSNSSNRVAPLGSDIGIIGLTPGDTVIDTPRIETRTFSLYGSVDYDIIPRLTLDVGARASFEHRSISTSQQGIAAIGFASFTNFNGSFNEKHLMPTASLTYKATDAITFYGRYARGEKSGGYNADFVYTSDPGGLPYRYKAETVDSYEIGVKSSLLNRAVTANAALFLNQFRDYQVFQYRLVNGVSNLSLTNAGQVKTYGVEFDLSARPTKGLTLAVSGSRLVATYTSFPDGGGIGVDYDGHRLEYAPKWNITASADYSKDVDLYEGAYLLAGVNYYYRSNSFADSSNTSDYFLPSANLLGARIGIGQHRSSGSSWQLALSVDNITKTRVFTNMSLDGFGTLVGFREQPRRYLAKLEFHY